MLSNVVLIGMPKKTIVTTFYANRASIPSELTTIVPTTPLWDWMRFMVSSTSLDYKLLK